MTGCDVALVCLVACLFGELSQQCVPPHSWHVRRCTHWPPIFTHSSHTCFFACLTALTASICAHAPPLIVPAPSDPISRVSRRRRRWTAGIPSTSAPATLPCGHRRTST